MHVGELWGETCHRVQRSFATRLPKQLAGLAFVVPKVHTISAREGGKVAV